MKKRGEDSASKGSTIEHASLTSMKTIRLMERNLIRIVHFNLISYARQVSFPVLLIQELAFNASFLFAIIEIYIIFFFLN